MARKSAKLPKKIAGVKISKKVRKSGNKLIEVASTPAGRELLAAGLIAAGAALAKAQKARRSGERGAEPAMDAAERGAQMAGQIGAAVGAAANAAFDRLLGGTAAVEKTGEERPPAGSRAH